MAPARKKEIRSTMRQSIFYGPKDLRLEVVDRPQPRKGEVLIKIETALTCGTDLKCYRRGHPVLLNHRLPSPLGHEFAGVVAAVGSDVTNVRIGQRVVAANSAPCGTCFYCKRGSTNLCDKLELLNGAYADFILIPKAIASQNLHVIPENLSFREAALTEPFACVVRAFDLLGLEKGQTLAIHGCGLMGLFFTALAKHLGCEVIAIGRSADKLERAKIFGADHVMSTLTEKNIVGAVQKLTHGRGADAVVEAIGLPETWAESIRLVRKGGTVCFYGGCAPGASFPLDTHRVHYDELKIFGVFHHTPKTFARALQLLSKGFLPTKLLVESEIRLADLPAHLAQTHDKPFAKTAVIP